MAKGGKKPAKVTRVSPLKPGLRGASRLVQSRMHAGIRAATLSRASMLRFSSSVLAALLSLALIALWLGGHLPTLKDNADAFKRDRLMAMGFTVDRIEVTGEGRLNEADVRAAVGIYEGDYFFGTDLKRAQRNTESLPWVDRAVVRRLWPNRIVVQLVETKPYALYQQDGVVHLVDRHGDFVAPVAAGGPAVPDGLKLFIGTEAASHAEAISKVLAQAPDFWSRTESLTRLPSGRWDVRMDDGVLVRLPEGEALRAVRVFQALEQRTTRRFAVVDLRLSDRITLTPDLPIDA